MTQCSVLNLPFLSSSDFPYLINNKTCNNHSFFNPTRFLAIRSSVQSSRLSTAIKAATAMEGEQRETVNGDVSSAMKLLFVEMGVGYDQHGQDITVAAMRACKDAISSNSIPAFRRGSIPGVTFGQMKLQIKLGVPRPLQQLLNIERVKSVFPYGEIVNVDVVDGGLICSSGVCVEEMGDTNDDCYIVNAAVYVEFKRETNKKGDEIFNAYLQLQQRQVSDVARTMFAQAGAVMSYVGT